MAQSEQIGLNVNKRASGSKCAHTMSDGNRDPAAKNAESGTMIVPTLSLDELSRCRGQLLGGGAFGKVYAINGFPDLAVKEIYLNGQPDRLVEITKFELEAVSRFSHPGVLKYHQVIEDGDFFYVVMDRYDGDLNKFITDHKSVQKPIPRGLMLSIVRQLADALAYVHAPYKVNEKGDVLPGIVHRDLKPANVLMNRDGDRVVIADFGLCKDAQHDGNTLAGTLLYMAPEAFIHRKTSRASDIWALGVIIYELVTLELPSFSRYCNLEDAKEFFVDGWKHDLSPVKDEFTRTILEKIFVLDPIERPTAGEVRAFLWALNASPGGHGPYTAAGEIALKDANARISALERERNIMSVEIDALKKELNTKSTKIDALEKQFTRIAEALEENARRRETEMDQQLAQVRTEADQHKKELDEALDAANDEIASLEEELATKSAKVDVFEQQLADAINKSDKLYQLVLMKDSSWTSLMCAAFIGDVELARSHLSDKDEKNSKGETALILAARAGHADVVELLDPTDWNRVTALMRAADRNDTEAVKALIPLQKGRKMIGDVTINEWQISRGTALMMAATRGYVEVVRLLMEHEGSLKGKNGMTALMGAAWRGHAECDKLLLEKEGGIQRSDGWTALMLAAQKGHKKAVEVLLEHEKGLKDTEGITAFTHALKNRYTDIALLLREYEAPSWTLLMCAAATGDIETAKQHLSDKDKKNSDGDTALIIAARAEHADIVEFLDPTDKNGITALMRAVIEGNIEMVELLAPLQKEMRNNEGYTALTIAAMEGRADIVELLDPTDRDGVTALMRAAERGDVEAVRALIPLQGGERMRGNNSMNRRCMLEGTALMIAADRGHIEVVRLLVEHEGDMRDNCDQTALMFAAQGGHTECVRLLVEKEGGIRDDLCNTALMWAAKYGHTECVKLLLEKEGGMRTAGIWGSSETALVMAARGGHTECVKLLAEKEKEISTVIAALDIARRKGHTEIVSILSGLRPHSLVH